ncbi:MAG TPA: phospholipase D-like domain-containing protein [Thermoplasmata archaeon]|nr:phospholipase D-like domain-containing protein [Thermoplasmata archaeon]
MRNRGRTLTALIVVIVLGSSPLLAVREADATDAPPPRPAPALFSEKNSAIMLTRVYANAARDDEFVELGNRGLTPVDLHGWSLSDGESTATFPLDAVLPSRGRLLVTQNSTSFAEDTLASADFTFERGEARRMEGAVLRLANTGDEVRLLDPEGTIVDAYVWGNSPDAGLGWVGPPAIAVGRGEIAVRNSDGDGWLDSDAAGDWQGLRRHRLGQSGFDPSVFELSTKTVSVLSPDDGDPPLLSFIASAKETIDVAVYTITSERIASALADAARRDVRVRVLLDGGPVGGIEDAEEALVDGLLAAGVDIRWLKGDADVVKRYRYVHAKYAIVDGQAAWIGSENFGSAGYPSAWGKGNRGWSVMIRDSHLAATLASVFSNDFDPRRRDTISAFARSVRTLTSSPGAVGLPEALPSPARRAQLVIAPDTALDPEGLLGLIASAQDHLWIEVFYLDEAWGDHPNPFLDAAFAAARRGVTVRILLDGSWSSVGDDSSGNDAIADRLNRRARNETLPFEARLLEPHGRIERLHNKGLVVDGRAVLVSSMNWAHGSATENREIGVILHDPDVAAIFEAAFLADWEGRSSSGVEGWRLEDPSLLLGVYAFVAVASIISLRKLRVGNKDIKPRARVRRRASVGGDLRRRPGEVRVLPLELVAQSRARPGGRSRARRGREEARGRLRGPEGD